MTAVFKMTPEEMNRLLDAYLDGSLEGDEGKRLAEAIRGDDKWWRWVLSQLEMRGLLTSAFDASDPAALARRIMERIHAEKSGGALPPPPLPDTAVKTATGKKTGEKKRTGGSALSLLLPFRALKSYEMSGEKTKPRPRRGLRAGIVALIISGILMAFFYWFFYDFLGGPECQARLSGTEGGVTVRRPSDEVLVPGPEQELFEGDRVLVSEGGKAEIAWRGGVRLRLLSGSSARLEAHEADGDPALPVILEKGDAEFAAGREGAAALLTPHARLVFLGPEGRASVSVTPSTTMVRMRGGSGRLLSRTGAEGVLVEEGEEAVAEGSGELEKRKARPENGAQKRTKEAGDGG